MVKLRLTLENQKEPRSSLKAYNSGAQNLKAPAEEAITISGFLILAEKCLLLAHFNITLYGPQGSTDSHRGWRLTCHCHTTSGYVFTF